MQNSQAVVQDSSLGLGSPAAKKTPSGFPQILQNMDEIGEQLESDVVLRRRSLQIPQLLGDDINQGPLWCRSHQSASSMTI